jgi:hypothetical protein
VAGIWCEISRGRVGEKERMLLAVTATHVTLFGRGSGRTKRTSGRQRYHCTRLPDNSQQSPPINELCKVPKICPLRLDLITPLTSDHDLDDEAGSTASTSALTVNY